MTERRVICQQFQNFVQNKIIICISVQLNILCLICINRQYPQNCIEFSNDMRVLLNFHSKYGKTRTISNTCESMTKFNMSGQRVNEVSAERLLRGRKHFLQSVMVSVAVSKLAETDLVFVQPDAKINSVYYCENVYSNKVYCWQFAVSQTTTSSSSRTLRLHTVHTTLSLRPTCIPMCPSSLNQKTGLFSVVSIAADGVSSPNFRH